MDLPLKMDLPLTMHLPVDLQFSYILQYPDWVDNTGDCVPPMPWRSH